jgi:hypothetical protein
VETAFYKARAVPGIALAVQVGWTGSFLVSDSDHDGVPDKIDACPKEAEDFDGFQDTDGCPEPDNDEDGILDAKDKCPTQAEDKDGIQDEDGCPETDYDDDGIPDAEDRCPLEPEDRDGFEDMDGCPDLDNDKDNVLDSQDKCPSKMEDPDGFEDEDGCPDPDNDNDGILDSLDKCPNEPETVNGYQDSDGCPEIGLQPAPGASNFPRLSVLRKVRFQGQTAALAAASFESLDSLAEVLKASPQIHIEIQVHSDNRGPEKAQIRSTQARAEAVRKHLTLKGVEKFRMVARGMGSQNPVASNRTPQGRLQNRRVEILRVE